MEPISTRMPRIVFDPGMKTDASGNRVPFKEAFQISLIYDEIVYELRIPHSAPDFTMILEVASKQVEAVLSMGGYSQKVDQALMAIHGMTRTKTD